MKKYLIVVAGGRGLRMGGDLPKQFLKIGGRAVLHRTIERFVSAYPDIRVVTVMNPDYIDFWKDYCLGSGMVVPQSIVRGGMTRFHSVKNALEKVWNEMEAKGMYAFQKSHAVCYTWLDYQIAYLKANYPDEFKQALEKYSD